MTNVYSPAFIPGAFLWVWANSRAGAGATERLESIETQNTMQDFSLSVKCPGLFALIKVNGLDLEDIIVVFSNPQQLSGLLALKVGLCS